MHQQWSTICMYRASENSARWACHAEAEILKWTNEWKKHFGLQTLHWSRNFFQTPCMYIISSLYFPGAVVVYVYTSSLLYLAWSNTINLDWNLIKSSHWKAPAAHTSKSATDLPTHWGGKRCKDLHGLQHCNGRKLVVVKLEVQKYLTHCLTGELWHLLK